MVRAMDHSAIEGAMVAASDRSGSEIANYSDCKLSYKVLI